MITPSKTSCKAKLIQFKSITPKWEDGLIEAIKEGFEDNPSFELVYKNFNYAESYKTWIQNGNKPDILVGYKTILQYPYDSVVFNIGDFIHWDYKHSTTLSTWLLTTLDSQHAFDSKGRILECNNFIKWKVGNLTYSVPCVFMDSVTAISFSDLGTDGVVEPNGTITVFTQQNSDTSYIKKNRRFMFGGISYLVKQILNAVNSNLLKVYLEEVPLMQEDDVENNIAWNGEQVIAPTITETVFEPKNISSVIEGYTQTFNVYKYVNSVKTANTFTFSASGVPSEYYELVSVNGNTFTLKCVKAYNKNAILLVAFDTIESTETKKEVWMKGGWL